MNHRIEKIERVTLLGSILTFLFFASIGYMVGLFILLGALLVVKIYVYTLYKNRGETDEFWKKSSKPAFVGLATISLLIALDYYGVF